MEIIDIAEDAIQYCRIRYNKNCRIPSRISNVRESLVGKPNKEWFRETNMKSECSKESCSEAPHDPFLMHGIHKEEMVGRILGIVLI